MKTNKKGFTLIELLVVIAIIGLLSTLAVIALNNARAKSRDARRVSDVKQIQSALELYYNDADGYPTALTEEGGDITHTATYLNVIPENPGPNGQPYTYTYTTGTQGGEDSYSLTFELELGTGGLGDGEHTASPSGITYTKDGV